VSSFGLVAIVGITLGGAGPWYLRSLPNRWRCERVAPRRPAPPQPRLRRDPAPLLVDVAGEVRKPGVYEFAEGDRVIDAIDAAGGATSKANLESLNLAAPVKDGVQVLVPAKVPVSGTAREHDGKSRRDWVHRGARQHQHGRRDRVEGAPGDRRVLSQAIVDYRTQNGPFATVDDLESVSGIGPSIMEGRPRHGHRLSRADP